MERSHGIARTDLRTLSVIFLPVLTIIIRQVFKSVYSSMDKILGVGLVWYPAKIKRSSNQPTLVRVIEDIVPKCVWYNYINIRIVSADS